MHLKGLRREVKGMIVVDVLLALNLVVLGACALRGHSARRVVNFHQKKVEGPRAHAVTQGAVILPLRPRVRAAGLRRTASIHPSRSATSHGH